MSSQVKAVEPISYGPTRAGPESNLFDRDEVTLGSTGCTPKRELAGSIGLGRVAGMVGGTGAKEGIGATGVGYECSFASKAVTRPLLRTNIPQNTGPSRLGALVIEVQCTALCLEPRVEGPGPKEK
ncbi:hypothetical protein AG1IA_01684 [Rhizoctonia solani AG-1 IA]|uniref:Uncharacterized protein n=1 Tax=Thanatephorus cucumeris (strain AG1-IA) TaxID=983506 RepID=L8X5C0_THACA|nr:hypothetical protein AG1IA_01684 [Rhizoctonia solani AG-1 IA]